MTEPDILSLIEKRRRQVLVHSTIYYDFNQNLVPDSTWAAWACELEELQNRYPEIAREGFMAKEFQNFEHSSGYNLPTRCSWSLSKAQLLLNYERRRNGG